MYGIHMINTLRTYNVCFVQYLYKFAYNNINCNLSNLYAHKAKI